MKVLYKNMKGMNVVPVPGGADPLTIAMRMENTLEPALGAKGGILR
jgi:5,10-methylene-tetrahydrofolate dehydrogenase/methenyl tetrahydrofolate cyclohydrolase